LLELDIRQLPDHKRELLQQMRLANQESTTEQLQKRLSADVLSKDKHFVHLIRMIRISGQFDLLRCGIKLVDLPGLRDMNASKAMVAQKYLQEPNLHLLVVQSMKRFLDKPDLTEHLNRVINSDFRSSSVHVVATQCDLLDDCNDDDDEQEEISAVAQCYHSMLEAPGVIQRTVLGSTTTTNADTLQQLQVFPVSAADYARLVHIRGLKFRTRQLFQTEESTGVPRLARQVTRISERAHDRLCQLRNEVGTALNAVVSGYAYGFVTCHCAD